MSEKGRFLFLLGFLAYFSSYIARSAYAASLPEIILDTGWDKSTLGLAGTMFFTSYAIGQLVNGIMGDKLSNRTMIFSGLILSAVCNCSIAFIETPIALVVIWTVNGFSLSMIWAPLLNLFSKYLNTKDRLYGSSRISFSIPIGTIASFLLTAMLLHISGWRAVFFVSGLIVFAIAIVWKKNINNFINAIVMAEERQEEKPEKKQEEKPPEKVPVKFYFLIFLVCLLSMVCGTIKDGVSMWVPTFLVEYYNLSSIGSVLISIVLPLTSVSGVIIAARLNKKFNSILFSGHLMFIFVLLFLLNILIFINISFVITVLLLALSTAMILGADSLLLSVFPSFFRQYGKTSSIAGIFNFSSYIACAVASYYVGVISKTSGWNSAIVLWVAIAFGGVLISFIAFKSRKIMTSENIKSV